MGCSEWVSSAAVDRRVLAAFLHFAHLFLAGTGIAVLTVAAWTVVAMAAIAAPAPGQSAFSLTSAWYFLSVLLVLVFWWGGFVAWAVVRTRRAMREAMEGDFAGASARLRWMFDHEPWLRLAGLNGAMWKQARVIEAYNDYLHGLYRDAIEIALEESRGLWLSPLKRAAATVAASAAGDMGDASVFDRIEKHRARARLRIAHPASQAILGGEGVAWANQLRLADALARGQELLAADPRSRSGLMLRAFVSAARGDGDAALADLDALRASPLLAKAKPAARELMTQLGDATRAELLREMGRLDEAVAIARGLVERPRHRVPRLIGVSVPGLAAARAGDREGAERAVSAIAQMRETWSFEPVFRARSAIALSRIERARGAPDRALAVLGDAVACPLPLLRQEGLLEQADARSALGDPAGAKQALEYVLEISTETRQARSARERLAAA